MTYAGILYVVISKCLAVLLPHGPFWVFKDVFQLGICYFLTNEKLRKKASWEMKEQLAPRFSPLPLGLVGFTSSLASEF